jgi:sugar/nucleoside kinase (ribokinase family)
VQPVAVIGHLARDVVEGGAPRIGGGPWYAARALSRLGIHARIAAKCGEPEQDDFRRQLATLGLPLALATGGETTGFEIHYDGEVRSMRVDAVGEPWTPEEAVDAIGDAKWVHVAPLLRSDFPAETLAALADGRHVMMDGQGLVRVPEPGPLRLDDEFDPDVLASLSVLKLASEEAEVIGSLDRLPVPEIIVTFGIGGSIVYAEGREEHVPPEPIVPGADPTGAGDAFAATYVSARADGEGPSAAAHRAAALVSELLSAPR